MENHYVTNKDCMNFSNDEIIYYLIRPCLIYQDINIVLKSYDDVILPIDTKEKIFALIFDGEKEDFSILFWDNITGLFILDQEFMFIDDILKFVMRSSDTYKNVVYEGALRDKTHKQILEIIFELFKIVYKAKTMIVEESVVSQKGMQYPKCNYRIRITNDSNIKKIISFENIEFIIN